MTGSPAGSQPMTDEYKADDSDELQLLDVLIALAARWRLLVTGPLVAAGFALSVSYLLPEVFTARTVLVTPQPQSAAVSAIAQLGALQSLAGAAAGIRSQGDQLAALLQSRTVAERLIDEFQLMKVYDSKFRFQAREELSSNTRISVGRKDNLIAIEVDDTDPQRAADIANRYVSELRRLTSELALSEAQQRRVFFEGRLAETRDRLTQAQLALQASGFSRGALKTDARAAAEGYARLRAEATYAEVRLQTLRGTLADGTAEVQQATATLNALRGQLSKLEESSELGSGPDYVSRFREFKYQETLFDLFARQYELARLDESREGTLIQVVDVAKPAEWKSRPKRALIALGASLTALVLLGAGVLLVSASADPTPGVGSPLARLRAALRARGTT
jgi:uncharacterized protein involved in exopolysaccharide biosynthesis